MMTFIRGTQVSLLLLISAMAGAQPLVLQPAISPNGEDIAFSYQGDIWRVPILGGRADRLTIHEGYEGHPTWSEDSNTIFFESDRFGNVDIFSISVSGGSPERLTYHSGDDRITGVTSTEKVIFSARRTYAEVEWENEFLTIPKDGGTPSRFLEALGSDAVLSPDGAKVLFVKGACRISREDYRGPANRDIWLYTKATNTYEALTTFTGNEFSPLWLDNNTFVYISPLDGKYNLYKRSLSGEEEQLTGEASFGINSFSLSRSKNLAVYQVGDLVKKLNISTGEISTVSINVLSDYRFDPIQSKKWSNEVTEFAVSPDSKFLAYVVRGEIFVTRNDKEDSRSVRITNNPARDQHVAWLNEGTLVFVSDRNGQYDLFSAKSADDAEKALFHSLKHTISPISQTEEEEYNPTISPDGKKIVFRQDRGKLLVASINEEAQLSDQKVLQDGWDTPRDVAWSPDSKWLAYGLADLNFNREIYIHDAENTQAPINISMHPKWDGNPVWSPDGSKLGFISMRNNGDWDVWFAWLKKEDWEKSKEARKREEKEKDEKKDEVTDPAVQIDIEEIYLRLERVTGFAGNESDFQFSKDGDWIYYADGGNGRQDFKVERNLHKIKWNGTEHSVVYSGNKAPQNLVMGPDNEKLYALSKGGKIISLKTKDDKAESLPVSSTMTLNYKEEKEQIFEEAWRALSAGFYDPKFHGNDWEALKSQYKPIVMKASTHEDFRYYFNLMLGQLNASHMGLRGGTDPKNIIKQEVGLLGVYGTHQSNGYLVQEVVSDSPADKKESRIAPGDIITSINQQAVESNTNIYSLLIGLSNEPVLVEVLRNGGSKEELIIWPVKSLRNELYDQWVRNRRNLVDTYSGGKLGYLHIRGMNWVSFERFERELMAAGYGKEGIVIDVRYNGGGWTTDYLMAVLNVKQHAYTVPRGAATDLDAENKNFRNTYPFSERLPLASWTKPSIALCNENSYSNAEIFSHAFKTTGIGKLVGKATFGAVISTGGLRLIDGSLVRMPFRAWYVKATGENMELGPAVPDIAVENPADYKSRGVDPQLKTAVETLLKDL